LSPARRSQSMLARPRDILVTMPFRLERDDDRRLVTVTVTEPFTQNDFFAVLDRHAEEDTWQHALLFDGRALAEDLWVDPASVKAHIVKAGAGKAPGPIAVIIGPHPDRFREALRHPGRIAGFEDFEVLITPEQVENWIRRHTHRRSP
jgi:hypothetical protein